MFEVAVNTRRALVEQKELITSHSAGIQVHFTLSEDWDGLAKLAVFRVGDEGTKVDVALGIDLTCVVPPEVLLDGGEPLFIGIYGVNESGSIIIPTIWASAGVVKPGTEPNTPASAEPTPVIWAQILGVATDAEQTAADAMSNVEAGLQELSAFENTVQNAEGQRQANELVRIANETERVAAETERSSAENSREVSEATRKSNEAARQATEQRRSNYETSWAWERDNFMRDGVSADTLPAGSDATATRYLIGHGWPGTDIPSASTIGSIKFGIPKGDTGEKGDQGDPGDDGVSPTVTVTDITGGHTVTITDADHPNGQSFNVMDGADGQDGADGSDGADGVIQSVNGKSAASITLDAGDLEFDDTETYAAGSIGKALSNELNALSALDKNKAPVIINSASGAIASFSDGADGLPVKKIVAQINPVQSAGTPSPENPLPISGFTGLNIEQRGKNLFDGVVTNARIVDGEVTATGSYRLSEYIRIKPNTNYILIDKNGASIQIYQNFFDGNKTWLRSGNVTTGSFVTPSDAVYLRFHVTSTTWNNGNPLMLCEGTSATPYEAYKFNTLPINWQTEAGTVYGGTLTVNEDGSGTLVVDKVKMSMTEYFATSGRNIEMVNGYLCRLDSIASIKAPVICNTFKAVKDKAWSYFVNLTGNEFMYGGGYLGFGSSTLGFTTKTEWETYLKNNVEICADLVTPQTYNLTALQVLETLLGTNNVWHDANGDISVTYRADTKLYIDGLTAPDEDMVADANIASGKYFVVNNQLYLSTAAIAAGASIVPGTNCTATNLAEALNTINT